MSLFNHSRRAVVSGIGLGLIACGGSGGPSTEADQITHDSEARALKSPASEALQSAAHFASIGDADGAIASRRWA